MVRQRAQGGLEDTVLDDKQLEGLLDNWHKTNEERKVIAKED
tara:strand:+ start:1032 stop:1157 length:126 start_codon:yes stop_codon:yes gene_type:complete